MLRHITGAVAGIVTAVLTVMLVQWIGHQAFPPPADLDVNDTEALSTYIAAAPIGALVFVLAGYFIATFDGVLVASLIGRAKPEYYGLLVGVLMLAATIGNLILIPHPAWFSACALIGIVIAAWLAVLISRRILGQQAST